MPMFRWYQRATPAVRLVVQLAALCSVLILTVATLAALVISLSAKGSADRVTASCRFYKDLASLPLTPQTTETGFTIVADARIAYQELRCVGTLPPPDPRVAAVLNKR